MKKSKKNLKGNDIYAAYSKNGGERRRKEKKHTGPGRQDSNTNKKNRLADGRRFTRKHMSDEELERYYLSKYDI